MGEIYVEATCSECGTEFDESDDCKFCCVCNEEFCEECQPNHAIGHIFDNADVVSGKKRNDK